MFNFKTSVLYVCCIIFFAGCSSGKIDIISYPTKIKQKVIIPEVCLPQYKALMPKVAVIDFTNNSTFGKAKINDTTSNTKSRTRAAGINAGIRSKRTILMAGTSVSKTKSKTISRNEQRTVDAKLSSSVTGPLETIVLNSGGANLFTRSDMSKIDTELKFQDSGLVDPKSIVKFGKTSGVDLIITGSIDNVEQIYRGNYAASHQVEKIAHKTQSDTFKLASAILSLGSIVTDGTFISTRMTVRLLDVSTGKILFSKQLEERVNIGRVANPSYDQIVGGVKASMLKSLPLLEKDMSLYFAVKGYITQLKAKDDEIIAQVNIGRDLKVEENQLFRVYMLDELEDPITGKITCDIIQTNTKLRASTQINNKTTWTTIEEGDSSFLKLGQLVEKTYEKGGFGIGNF